MRMRAHPYTALAVLTGLNFLNYIDRSILFQVQPLIQQEFGISKLKIGLLTTAFTICLVVAAPVVGFLADRYERRPIIAAGAILWSIATLLSAFTWNFQSLLVRHAIVGIGEACMVAAPAFVSEIFPVENRARTLAFLYMGGPVGTALGYVIGGALGSAYGWRAPFYVVAAPGVILAILLLGVSEPVRSAQVNPNRKSIANLFRNGAYISATLGVAMITFAVAGAQVWLPDFLINVRRMTMVSAAGFIGGITVINGTLAVFSGGWIADRIRRHRKDADYFFCAVIAGIAVPVTLAGIYLPAPWMFGAIFGAEFLFMLSFAPLGAAVLKSVEPGIRSTAFALHVVAIRLMGDALASAVIGHIADRTGSLEIGLTTTVIALSLATAILFYGRRFAMTVATSVARNTSVAGA